MVTTPESVQALLSSEDYGQRLSGVNQLRTIDPAIAFKMIQPIIGDSNVRVRYAAVSQLSVLGQQDPSQALDLLRRSLNEDPEADVRAAAADSLAALKLTDAFEDLQRTYHQSQEWLVQFSIIAALGELGDRRAFDILKEALDSPNELVRMAAIGSLGELGDERAIDLLLACVDADDWQVRHRVAQALSNFQTPEVRSAMSVLAEDTSDAVAQQAKLYL